MLPTRSIETVHPASVHQVTKRSRISLSASVSARRRRPPALPGPISPERMTVIQNRAASMVSVMSRAMGLHHNGATYPLRHVAQRVLEVHREPARPGPARSHWGYAMIHMLGVSAAVAPLAVPRASVRVADLFP